MSNGNHKFKQLSVFYKLVMESYSCLSHLTETIAVITLRPRSFGRNFEDDISKLILTHWGRVTHICVGKLTIIGSDNGLSLGRRQAIIWPNAGILLIRPLGTNFREILIGIQTFSFKKMCLKMSSAKWRPFCLGLNVLTCGILIECSPKSLPRGPMNKWKWNKKNEQKSQHWFG